MVKQIHPVGFAAQVRNEMVRARREHRPFASWHEAYAVILEELEEFWDSVKRDEPDLCELAQVAACCELAAQELDPHGVDGPVVTDGDGSWEAP